jgi:ankyrin repeat protein
MRMSDSTTRIPATEPLAIAVVSAIRDGDLARLQGLLRARSDLATARIVDERGVARSLLHVAADWPGHFPNGPATVAALAAAGADVNARMSPHPKDPNCAETPLHWAASSNDIGVIDALLDAGADIEAPGAIFTGGAPMSDAVVFAQWDAARRLLERGAQTTLSQAAALGLTDRVRELCEAQPPPTAKDITNALWHACRGGRRAAAEYLQQRGADMNWVGWDGQTPVQVAEKSGDADLVAFLRTRAARAGDANI